MTMSELQVVAGNTDITPMSPIPVSSLAGFKKRIDDASEAAICDPIECNIIVLRSRQAVVALVQMDTLYVGTSFRRRLMEKVGDLLDEQSLFIIASHTHFAPATDETLPGMGNIDSRFIDWAVSRVAALLTDLLQSDGVPARLTYARSVADHNINRRKPTTRWSLSPPFRRTLIALRPNPDGIVDKTTSVLTIADEANKPCAVVWNYACHPVLFPEISGISAEFPGVVRSYLRNRHGDALPVVFLQGFAGDVLPKQQGENHPRKLSEYDVTLWHSWSESLAERVNQTMVDTNQQSIEIDLATARATVPLTELALGETTEKSISIHGIRLGRGLGIIGLSAEPVSAYTSLLSQLFKECWIIPAGYIDGVYGYLPTSSMLEEGGYEADGFRSDFSIDIGFRHDLSEAVADLVRETIAPILVGSNVD